MDNPSSSGLPTSTPQPIFPKILNDEANEIPSTKNTPTTTPATTTKSPSTKKSTKKEPIITDFDYYPMDMDKNEIERLIIETGNEIRLLKASGNVDKLILNPLLKKLLELKEKYRLKNNGIKYEPPPPPPPSN
jgi:hypothetical protein